MSLFEPEFLPERPKPLLPIDQLSSKDFVRCEDGISRVADWRLAQVLPLPVSKLRQLTERQRTNLETFGTLYHRGIKSTGGRPAKEYRYNFNQSIWIINRSEAPNATEVQKHVVIIYGMLNDGELVPRDAQAAAKVEASVTKAREAAPELMELLHGVALRDDIQKAKDELAAQSARHYAELHQAIVDHAAVPRRPASPANEFVYDQVVIHCFDRCCPIAWPKRIQIIGDNDEHLDSYHQDHVTDNRSRNGLYDIMPMSEFSHKKMPKERWAAATRKKMETFFGYVAEFSGQPNLFED